MENNQVICPFMIMAYRNVNVSNGWPACCECHKEHCALYVANDDACAFVKLATKQA